ncbi:voltage-gated potassium channel [Peniophora sp. CONT]|nr:voltage-gated potassium channel [Peniophora sp. CONT]
MASSSIPLTSLGGPSHFLHEQQPPPDSPTDIHDVFSDGPGILRASGENEPINTSTSSRAPVWKRNLFSLLEHPTSSPAAFVVHIFITGLILISALVTILETVPEFHEISSATWFGLETSLVALFTIEYIARCVAWSLSWRTLAQWVGSFFGIIDLLAIVPYYIEIALHQDTSSLFRFSILRTFRLLRVFKAFRYNNVLLLTIEVMFLSFRRSQHALLALGFFVGMVLIVFSTLLYFIERGTWDENLDAFINADGDVSQFASIPAAGWFVLVTITTVGYGEITPRSFLGRLITLPLLVFGLLLIALPSFVLGREFSIVWNEMTKDSDVFRGTPDVHSPRLVPQTPPAPSRRSASIEPGARSASPHSGMYGDRLAPRDLSNRKLAQNQTELFQQVADLKSVIEKQGEMLRLLVERGQT